MAKLKKNVNFLAKDELAVSPIGRFLKWTLGTGRILVIITNIIVISVILIRFKLDNDLSYLNDEIKEQQLIVNASQELEQNVKFTQKRLSLINKHQLTTLNASELLNTLSALMPLDVTLTKLSLTKNTITLNAQSLSNAGLATLLNTLKTSGRFDQIDLQSVDSGGVKNPTLQFQLSAQILPAIKK